ncbi:MAG: glycerol-3-phosphate 1-O-acyltransferase PlsY [Spirochaetes bacterium]|nr:glycerol-3-phosphate 1-O-acyltransferase PlsY [Spirochaetota bacterium]
MTVRIVLPVVIALLVGAIPTGYLLAKLFKRIDIREHGSGNIGFTNVLRTSGVTLGLVVLIVDVAKAWAATRYLSPFFEFPAISGPVMGIFVLIGNIFNPFLRFKGGKGVATGLGVAIAISPFAALCALITFGILLAAFRYVSVGSLCAAFVFSIYNAVLYFRGKTDVYTIVFSLLLTAAVFARHISNIQRLLHGEESRIGKREG